MRKSTPSHAPTISDQVSNSTDSEAFTTQKSPFWVVLCSTKFYFRAQTGTYFCI